MTSVYAAHVPQLAVMARSLVRDLDPQNDLQFLRLRAKEHEIMVYSGAGGRMRAAVAEEGKAGAAACRAWCVC